MINIARDLSAGLQSNPNLTGPYQWGQVHAIHTGPPSVDVYLDGSAILTPNLPYLASYIPQVGDTVMVGRGQGSAKTVKIVLGASTATALTPVAFPITPPDIVGASPGPNSPGTPSFSAFTTGVDNIAQADSAYISVTWNANAAGDNVVAYELRWRKTGDSLYYSNKFGNSTGAKIAGLIPGQSYGFQLRAINNLGAASAFNTEFTQVAASDVTAPAVPTGLSAIKTPRGALVSWTANTEADLQGYRLKVSVGGGAYSIVFDKQLTTSFAYVVPSGTAQGTNLTFEIAAVDWSGNYSADSAASAAVPTDGIVFDELLAGNLKVFGTLTTGGLQTASSGARLAMDSTSLRAYDGTANNYGAPSGAGVAVEFSHTGSGFFSGTLAATVLHTGGIQSSSASFVPSIPGSFTGYQLDPTNGLRFFNGGTLTSQYDATGVSIFAGTIAGPTIYSPSTAVGGASASDFGIVISGATLSIYSNASGFGGFGGSQGVNCLYWNGSAWATSASIYPSGSGSSATTYIDVGYGTANAFGLGLIFSSAAGARVSIWGDQGTGSFTRAAMDFQQLSANDVSGTAHTYEALCMREGNSGTNYADFFVGNSPDGHNGAGITRRADLRWYNYTATNVNPTGRDISYPQRYSFAPTTITLTAITDALNGGTKTLENLTIFGCHFYINGQTAATGGGVTENYWTASGGS